MEKQELTKNESELYLKIVQKGTFDDMFDFAYAIGRERFAQEQIKKLMNENNPPQVASDEIKCKTCDGSTFIRQNSRKFPVIKCPFCK